MGRICAAICTSHSPYLYVDADEWEPARAIRSAHGGISSDVPVDSVEENRRKHRRSRDALSLLRAKLEEASPDILLIFGDDQAEQFSFENHPALSIFAGDEFSGFKISGKFGLPVPGVQRADRPRTPEHWATVPGSPDFARRLIVEMVRRDFDPAFNLGLPRPEDGIGHAFMRPLFDLCPAFDIPTVPVFVNCYYGPQPTGRRCVQFGAAIRAAIEAMPDDFKVALIGSGGLWHTPMFPAARLDEKFDSTMLANLAAGDAQAMGTYFDSRTPPVDSSDPESLRRYSGGTGMVLGYGAGTGETRNWIITAAAMGGRPATIVDYVPAYASPIGLAFAYWNPA